MCPTTWLGEVAWWTGWVTIGVFAAFLVAVPVSLIVGRHLRRREQRGPEANQLGGGVG